MKVNIALKQYWEENISLLLIILGFVDILSEEVHEVIKWPLAFLGVMALFLCLLLHQDGRRKIHLIFAVTIIVLIEKVFSDGIFITQYIWDLGICLSVACCIYCAKKVTVEKWLLLYTLVAVFLFYGFITSLDSYMIFYRYSRNYISVFLIALLFFVSIISDKAHAVLPNWIIYTTVGLSVMAIGRGGIIASLVILAMHIFNKVKNKDYSSRKNQLEAFYLFFGFIILAIVLLVYHDSLINTFFPRFGDAGKANNSDYAYLARLMMWKEYINVCLQSSTSFVLGANPYPITGKYLILPDFNLHNSYLILHAFYGIFGVVGFLCYTIKYIKLNIKNKQVETVIVLIGFLVRSLTDHCFPGCLTGIIMWIVIFYGSDKVQLLQQGVYNEKIKSIT